MTGASCATGHEHVAENGMTDGYEHSQTAWLIVIVGGNVALLSCSATSAVLVWLRRAVGVRLHRTDGLCRSISRHAPVRSAATSGVVPKTDSA